MSEIWRIASGSNLGTIEERSKVNLSLPLANGSLQKNLRFSLISGALPGGLRLEEKNIVGVALEVVRPTTSMFVLRAEELDSDGRVINIEDRTYELTVEGFDPPEWRTPQGLIDLTGTKKLFVLDNTFVDFQLSAVDNDLPAGDTLEFFIAEGSGALPPGLTLYPDGRITGYIDPILALDVSAQEAFFDGIMYDTQPFDYGEPPDNGADSYPYDAVPYGYSVRARTPKKLNRNYEFIASVSDGENIVTRRFRVYVVGDDFLRADNTIMRVGTGVFTSDNTYLRAPVWITPNNLGVRRANNYVTVFLDTFDANPDTGPVSYELAQENRDGSDSVLPPGLFIDQGNGEIFGFAPYQPAVTKEYKFTVTAFKYDANAVTEVEVIIRLFENSSLGQTYLKIYPLLPQDVDLILYDTLRIGNFAYVIQEYQDSDPVTNEPYEIYAILKLSTTLLLSIPAETILTKSYRRSAILENITSSSKEFYISIIGEVDSVINFDTGADLGNLRSNFFSQLSVKATTSVPRAVLTYKVVGGVLPFGLELRSTGEISGKVLQFGREDQKGLTLIDTNGTTFDNAVTTFDREFVVSIKAEDQFKFSAVTKDFTIRVIDADNKLYTNIYVRPYQRLDKKSLWQNFISDNSIFTISKIYRPSDPAFGIQRDLKMLIYPGVEVVNIPKLYSAISKNSKKKRFKIGDLKKAVAKKQGTDEIVYEVLYLDVIDPYENVNGSVGRTVSFSRKIKNTVLINQANFEISNGKPGDNLAALNNPDPFRMRLGLDPITIDDQHVVLGGNKYREFGNIFPTTVENIRKNIEEIVNESGESVTIENEYLPLWMKTSQNRNSAASGFVKAVPICYCNPGDSDYIIANIRNSGFNFTDIDYEIDRLIVESTFDRSFEQYIKFSDAPYNI